MFALTFIAILQALIEREQMNEELSALRERFESLVNEHKSAMQGAKNCVRTELKNEFAEMENRLRYSTDAEAKLQVGRLSW